MIQFFLDLVSLNTTHPTHPPLEVNVLLDILLDGIWDFIDLIENIQQRRRERQKHLPKNLSCIKQFLK